MILTLFISNIFIYLQVNKIAGKMDTVYASNVNLSELSEAWSMCRRTWETMCL